MSREGVSIGYQDMLSKKNLKTIDLWVILLMYYSSFSFFIQYGTSNSP